MTSRIFSILLAVIVIAFAAATLPSMHLAAATDEVAYVSEEEGGISEIDLSTMKVIRRVQPSAIAPRGLAVTFDGKYVITSNKDTSDIAIFSTPQLDLVKRIRIGDNPEFIKIDPSGSRLFATYEPSSQGGPPPAAQATEKDAAKGSAKGDAGKDKDKSKEKDSDDENGPPAQIASFHVGDWVPGPTSTAGQETEGIEFSRDGKLMLLTMDASFKVIKSVPTAAKPYGVAFDRAGKRIFVSAAQRSR